MSFRSRFGKAVFCAMLAFSSIAGAPMRPDEVEELMHKMNETKVVCTVAGDAENGEDAIASRSTLSPY
jgi:hypothetical protein